jgi:poly(3-hydroxybutyrate) depolymerase
MAGGKIEPGTGTFRFIDEQSNTDKPLRVRFYHPPSLHSASPIVFVLHGTNRNSKFYRKTWTPIADRYGFLLLCPRFAPEDYPARTYHLGNIVDRTGNQMPKAQWTFGVIERLFDWVRTRIGNTSSHYAIYGHSAGAQFVHRMALFMPEARFSLAIAANAGWYTMPTFDSGRFPYSLSGSDATPELLAQALSQRMLLLLGEDDTDVNDPHLKRSKRAMQQGQHRFERGLAFLRHAQHQAEQLGVPLQWSLKTVPGVGHDDEQMMPDAAAELAYQLGLAERSAVAG